MKIGVSYNLWDGADLLEGSILRIRPFVDYITVVFQEVSNHGNKLPNYKETVLILNYLKGMNLIDKIIYASPKEKNAQHNELIKRNMVKQHHIRFDETMVSNDVMFSAMIGAEAQKIDVSLETIYCLTRSTDSLTMSRLEKNFDKRFEIGLNLHRYLKEKLSAQRYAQLDLPALVFVLQAFQYHLGIKKALWVYKQLKQQNIPVFRLSLFNKRRLKQLKRK
jgi:hypothetical protein